MPVGSDARLLSGFEPLEPRQLLATLATSPTTPLLDGADIAILNAAGQIDLGGNEGHILSNRPVQGQTFTTGAEPGGYILRSFSLQNEENTVNNNTATFTGRIGTVAGTTLTQIHSETSNNSISYVPNDYMTFVFDTPVALAPSTLYGFDLATDGSGFTTWANANTNYAGGEGSSSGGNHIPNDANLVFRGVDRIFHVDLDVANDAPQAIRDNYQTSEDDTLSATDVDVAPRDGDSGDGNIGNDGVLVNDIDFDPADSIRVVAVEGRMANVGSPITLASGAELTLNADGTFNYDPSGSDDIQTLSDGDSYDETFT